ncbi:hypothetical protein [Streptomyces sp. TLI_105]|uniref:hypothetical protein n=1 Tax=Streptomyces sp. TLI_105 TaxID=1881019 RepID=UPI00089BF45B|nr:hypothetical protein [Streptomyces sp. TLI_105]SEC72374.1 hypothetical protein SAMN05428939_3104 [Streptomyces sp. TLI_105]
MDTEPAGNRREQVTDWLESHPDLPHLFARLAELVHVAGYAPEDLVVLPRAEMDRRETAAFTAGWAEAVSDELPRIRREYERRVADAYAQGQGDARGIRRPQRRTDAAAHPDGARVIPLPFARLMEPPAAVVKAEERVRRERELFEQRPEPEYEAYEPEPAPAPAPVPVPGYERVPLPGYGPEPEHASDREPDPGHGAAPDSEPESDGDARAGSQESRPRRNAQSVRKVVRGKGGRPIVPPIGGVPGQGGGTPDRRGRRLSERARTLEEELAAERAQEAPPDPAS